MILCLLLTGFHSMRSLLAPHSAVEYRPREANFVADYLAGQASALLIAQLKSGDCPPSYRRALC